MPCGILGLAVGGLATPETEEDPDGRRVGDSIFSSALSFLPAFSGLFSCTVSRMAGRGAAAALVVALRTRAGAGGTPKPVSSRSSFCGFFFAGGAGSMTAGIGPSVRIVGIGRSYSTWTV